MAPCYSYAAKKGKKVRTVEATTTINECRMEAHEYWYWHYLRGGDRNLLRQTTTCDMPQGMRRGGGIFKFASEGIN